MPPARTFTEACAVVAGPGGIFVGREREMAELTVALEDALAGRGRVVMLFGEPGIGKTRLCEEVSAIAISMGMSVTTGRASEEPCAPPYWPWRPLFRTLRDQSGAGDGRPANTDQHEALEFVIDSARSRSGW